MEVEFRKEIILGIIMWKSNEYFKSTQVSEDIFGETDWRMSLERKYFWEYLCGTEWTYLNQLNRINCRFSRNSW